MKYSVITPAHNEEKFIGACLQSILDSARHCHADVEMIVALNRCTDQTESIALSKGAIIVIENEKNIARIRNAAAKSATGDVIVTLDADSCMHINTFSEIRLLLESEKFIGGGTKTKPERWSLGIFMSLLSIVPYVIAKGVSTGMFWCYSKDFRAIHGFDESLVTLEDADFGQRLKALGKSHGLRYGTLRKTPIITSCAEFPLWVPGDFLKGDRPELLLAS